MFGIAIGLNLRTAALAILILRPERQTSLGVLREVATLPVIVAAA